LPSHRSCFALLAACAVIAGVSLLAADSLLAGVAGSPHDFFSPGQPTRDNTNITPAGVCSACHIPHNALYGALWPRDLLSTYDNLLGMNGGTGSSDKPNYKRQVTVQCYDCHDAHSTPMINNDPQLNWFDTNHKPQNIAFGFTKTSLGNMTEDPPAGSVAGYYENNPPYLPSPTTYYGANSTTTSPFKRPLDNATLAQSGGHYFKSQNPSATVYKGDKLGCSECHDPHAWDSADKNWHAFFRPSKLYGYPSRTVRWQTIFSANPRASTFMANPVASGVQSRSDVDSRKMCVLCHGESTGSNDSVTFNDINSDYTSAEKIIRPPASIGEHAPNSQIACVSCHNHNAIGANCSQCHGFPPSDTATVRYPSSFTPSPLPGVDNDSHARHYGAKQGQTRNANAAQGFVYAIDCGTCHYGSAMGIDSSLQQHQNALVSVVIQGVWTKAPNGPGGAYDNTNYYNQAYGTGGRTGQLDNGTSNVGWGAAGGRYGGNTCRNVYCHSAGRAIASMALDCTVDFPRPVWNSGPQHCNDCHGSIAIDNANIAYGMPNYPSGPVGSSTANTHGAHVVNNRYECYVCHRPTVDNNFSGPNRRIRTDIVPSSHVDNVRQVVFDGVNATGSYDNTSKTCTVSCHGADAPRWGGAISGCAACHLSATGPDSDVYLTATDNIYSPHIAGKIDNTEWMYSGHGKAAGNYDVSLHPAANLMAGGSGGGEACYYCHDPDIQHRTIANPFRLKDQAGAASYLAGKGWNATCLVCHFHSSTPTQDLPVGYDPDNTATVYALKRATAAFVDNAHYGTEHSATFNGGQFCWDCHDPHGDRPSAGVNNIFMVQGGATPTTRTAPAVGTILRRSDGVYGIRGAAGLLSDNPPVFSNVTSGANYADNTTYQGICQVCHTQGTTSHYRSNFGDGHNAATRCTTCHLHDAAFKGLGGPDVGQYFDRKFVAPGAANYADNSSHPLRGLTTTDNTPVYAGTENCLGCHWGSGLSRTGDECVKCHFEAQPNAPTGNHMDKVLQLATIAGNALPTAAYPIATIQEYDAWCLQCHKPGATTSLGGITPSVGAKTIINDNGFANGRHRAQSPEVGCIYCHQPHGRGNTKLVRENPENRRNADAGPTPARFNVFPNDNLSLGGYGTAQNVAYRSRPYWADNTLPYLPEADDDQAYCNKACHAAKFLTNFVKDKMVKRDGTTGKYLLTPGNKKIYLVSSKEYTSDNITLLSNPHVHTNGDIITTDNMVRDYANLIGLSGPSYYQYPLSGGSANPSAYNPAVSDLPFLPDFNGDGFRDFTNAWNNLGVRIAYRHTCSTCHNPHGTAEPNDSTAAEGYPDLRLRKANPNTLCNRCHK
jgi:predicted CxxxxCH...CXXCH cytochrome family protein